MHIVQSAVLRSHVVCLSVRLSVTLVAQDHIGWKSWKLIARSLSPTPSLFVAQRSSTYFQGNMGKFWGDYRGGVGKMAFWGTKAAISLKRVKIEKNLLWAAYRNSPSLFRTVPSATPYGLPFPRLGFPPHPKLQSILSQERVKLRTSNLASTFTGSIRTKSPLKILEKREHGRIQGLPYFFRYPRLSQERVKLQHSNFACTFIG